jgi:hypothetical protein
MELSSSCEAASCVDTQEFSNILWNPSLINLISSFLSQRKFRVPLEGETSTPREMQQGCHKVPSCPLHCIVSTLVILLTPSFYLALFPDDTCLYAIECKEGYVLRKLQRGLDATETV